MTFDAWVEILKTFGFPLAALIVVIYTGAKGIWVYGYVYRLERERADKFQELALDLLQTTKVAVGAAERAGERHA